MSGGLWAQSISAINAVASAIRGIGFIDINPVGSCVLASTGGQLVVFADSANNPSVAGIQITNSETFSVRWNNAATCTGIARNVALPRDLDGAYPIVFKALVSKTGATDADDTSLTISAFITSAGDLHDADADCGGATGAVVGTATAKTMTQLSRTIAAADIPDNGPCNLSITIAFTAGTLETDDLVLHTAWLEYTKKAVAS